MTPPASWPQDQKSIEAELAVLEEWHTLQQHFVAFPHPSASTPATSWRQAMEALLHHSTQGRVQIYWHPANIPMPTNADRWLKVCYGKKLYGYLGFAPGYLISMAAPYIAHLFAWQCALLLTVAEYQTFLHYRLQGLSPLLAPPSLTLRERSVLLGLARGEKEQTIAQRLGITVETLHTHRQSLYRHLGVNKPEQAVARGFVQGLIDWLDMPCALATA